MAVQHKNLTHPNVRTFYQHGFRPIKEASKNQIYGNCIFCNKPDKFFLNVETKAWDCKVCNKEGGFQSWLREVLALSQTQFKGPVAVSLSRDRGIAPETLKTAGIGWNKAISAYILPVYTMDGGRLHDLKIFKNKKLMSTAGCQSGLFGWEQLKGICSNIWLAEGEWDCLVMREAFSKVQRNDEIVLAVPGANTFKNEWVSLFKDLNVNVLYDNDPAGRDGSVKVYNKIKSVTKKLNFLHWRENEKEGMDVRDIYKILKNKPLAFLKRIQLKLKNMPQDADKSKIKITNVKNIFKFEGKGHSAQEVYSIYTKWLELKNTDVIDVLYGTMIANRLPGDPIWLLLVAASGGTKSELLMSFDDVINVTSISSLTPHTLISGATFAGGGDPSLIPMLDQKVLIIKDLTTILSMNPMQREEIYGQLRDAYDGKSAKPFGNGLLRMYESKFGLMAGVTPMIEIVTEGHTALGERFLRWFVADPLNLAEEQIIIRRAMSNTTHEETMRKELKTIAKETLAYNYNFAPTVNDTIKDRIMNLAQWTAMLRGTINRDKFSKEVTHQPFKELATRLAKQYYKQLLGMGMFRRISEVSEDEYKILCHIGIGTIPGRMRTVLGMMYREGKDRGWKIDEIENRIKLPYNTCERIVEDMRMLGALRKVNTNKLKSEWVLTNNIKQLTEGSLIWQ